MLLVWNKQSPDTAQWPEKDGSGEEAPLRLEGRSFAEKLHPPQVLNEMLWLLISEASGPCLIPVLLNYFVMHPYEEENILEPPPA